MTIAVNPLWILIGLGVFLFIGWFLRGLRERQRRENRLPYPPEGLTMLERLEDVQRRRPNFPASDR